MKHTYLKYVLGVAVQIAALCSCGESPDMWAEAPQHMAAESDGVVEVMLNLPSLSVMTRTSIGEDNGNDAGNTLIPKWDVGDSFGLIVRGVDDNDVDYHLIDDPELDEPYKFTHTDNVHDLQGNIFVGLMPRMPLDVTSDDDDDDEPVEPVEPARYNYYALYPYQAVSGVYGSDVRCTIPSVQSGRYDDGADIMLAAAQGVRLNQQHLNSVDFRFRHLTHALKITVPAERDLFGHDVTRITIEFEKPVAGEAALNLTAINAANPEPSLNTAGLDKRTITVNFDEEHPFVAGGTFWVFIAPVDLTGTTVRFSVYNDKEGWLALPVDYAGFKVMDAQYITPVNMTLNRALDYCATWFDYEILDESSRLGEELESLNLTLPAGLKTGDGEEGTVKLTEKINLMGNTYRIIFRANEFDAYMDSAGSLDFLPKYESEHAILSPYATDLNKFVVVDGNYSNNNFQTIDHVPYLFEEDFSGVESFAHNDEFINTSSDQDEDKTVAATPYELDAYNLVGWTGVKIGADKSYESLRIGVRVESSIFTNYMYHGRADSAPLNNIKNGKTPNVEVSFNYSMNLVIGTNITGGNKIVARFAYGYHNTKGPIKGTDGANPALNSPIEKGLTGTGGDYSNITEYKQYIIKNCASDYRLAWEVYADSPGASVNANANGWVYLDNIKVSIAK